MRNLHDRVLMLWEYMRHKFATPMSYDTMPGLLRSHRHCHCVKRWIRSAPLVFLFPHPVGHADSQESTCLQRSSPFSPTLETGHSKRYPVALEYVYCFDDSTFYFGRFPWPYPKLQKIPRGEHVRNAVDVDRKPMTSRLHRYRPVCLQMNIPLR